MGCSNYKRCVYHLRNRGRGGVTARSTSAELETNSDNKSVGARSTIIITAAEVNRREKIPPIIGRQVAIIVELS